MKVVESDAAPTVELAHHEMILRVRPGADTKKKQAVVEDWYRRQVKEAAPPLIALWEKRMGVKVKRVFVQRMKTRWGSCRPGKGSIRLNTELARKPRECLEYVVVHELAHLLVPSHNARFVALMDQFMPTWKQIRDELNRAPLGHVEWEV